jgi:hypothetical protein
LQEGHRPERYYVILQGQALRARSIAGASLSVIGVFSAGSCVGDENNCLYLGDKRDDSFFVKGKSYEIMNSYINYCNKSFFFRQKLRCCLPAVRAL